VIGILGDGFLRRYASWTFDFDRREITVER
jgi:hypothetical protein